MLIRNTSLDNLTVQVPNVYIATKIIQAAYGFGLSLDEDEKIDYTLCCSYLNLRLDKKILREMIVKPEQYDSLVILASENNFDDFYLRLLIKHVPDYYDLKKLSPELLQLMKDKSVVSPIDYFAQIDNQYTHGCCMEITKPVNQFKVVYPNDFKKLKSGDRIIFSNDGSMAAIIEDEFYSRPLVKAFFTTDSKFLVIVREYQIVVIDLNNTTKKTIYNEFVDKSTFVSLCNNFIFSVEKDIGYFSIVNFDLECADSDDFYEIRTTTCRIGHIHDIVAIKKNTIVIIYVNFISLLEVGIDICQNYLDIFSKESDHRELRYSISPDYNYLALLDISFHELIVIRFSDQKIFRKHSIFNRKTLIYFSSDNKHIIFRNETYHSVQINDDGLSELTTNVPERKYEDIKSELFYRIEKIEEQLDW